MIVVQLVESMLYDGTNGAEIIAWVGNAELVEVGDDGALTMSVTAYGLTYDIRTEVGWYVLRNNSMHYGSLSAEAYKRQYHELPGT
ncbi:hypothetical protein [Streptomyces sp. NPDC014623]|uniref:hypothetical protein n=1 Tax=Streptomyces sp. NPDC014623 TaxID=3364875 RepID=UPI0036FF24CB